MPGGGAHSRKTGRQQQRQPAGVNCISIAFLLAPGAIAFRGCRVHRNGYKMSKFTHAIPTCQLRQRFSGTTTESTATAAALSEEWQHSEGGAAATLCSAHFCVL